VGGQLFQPTVQLINGRTKMSAYPE